MYVPSHNAGLRPPPSCSLFLLSLVSQGTVNYVNKQVGKTLGIVESTNNYFRMAVDTKSAKATGRGRNSIRIVSKDEFADGVYILDVDHSELHLLCVGERRGAGGSQAELIPNFPFLVSAGRLRDCSFLAFGAGDGEGELTWSACRTVACFLDYGHAWVAKGCASSVTAASISCAVD